MTELKYAYIPPAGDITRHMWTLVGENGGIHIWAEPTSDAFRGEQFYGGIETHSKKRVYDWDAAPSHEDCWLLGCPCWHDGSSLYFSERIEPLIRNMPTPFDAAVHEFMNAILFDWYRSRFEEEQA